MSSTLFSRTLLGVVLASATVSAQAPSPAPAPQQPAPQQPTGPSPGNQGPGTRPGQGMPGTTDPRGQRPFPGQQDRQQFPEMQRMFFFSGKVMLEDGTPPPDPVVVERVCNGIARPEGYTDSKGRFSFQLGQNTAMMADASVGADTGFGDSLGGQRSMGGFGGPMGGRGISERDLMGCELRASLAGFRSDVVSLAGRRALDNPDVGTIVLHRLAKVDGFTFSATTAYAPKNARKAFDKGREQAKKKKFENAEKELNKAVTEYPKFAAAWYELGTVYQMQNKLEDARKAYTESMNADPKFVNPYAPLARLAAMEKKWEEAADLSGKLIKLNPYVSPDAYFVSSVANLNLNRADVAEEHAREAAKMDKDHRNPRINHLLAIILQNKRDYAGAAASMRDYLKYAPNAQDADQIRQQLAEVEKQLGASAGTAQAQ